MTNISKRFPGVRALDDVQLMVRNGEVHAVVGENGAGKSTLMHILAGVHQPDTGRIDVSGKQGVRIQGERMAQHLGIAIVYQERSLFESLSLAENIFAGRQPVWGGVWIARHRMISESRKLLAEVNLALDPATLLGALSPAEQQLVEIAKALSLNARLIILDEPTAALTEFETKTLFAVIRRLRSEGKAVIYISHRLNEVFELADRVTVLKDGRWQATLDIAGTNPDDLVRRMVGRDLRYTARRKPAASAIAQSAETALEVQYLCDSQRGPGALLRDVSFRVAAGEIVALAGLAGAGRTETAMSIFGARPYSSGNILVGDRRQRIRCIPDAIGAGIGYMPEDRKLAGLFLDMSIAHNIAVTGLSQFGRILTNQRKLRGVAESYRERLDIASSSVQQSVRSLSGGGQQKVLLAKWLLIEPRVLIVDEPTRGVDVGAKVEVHQLLVELAERGTAVIVISSDLTEVLALGERIMVMACGQIVGEMSGDEATEERIIHLASQSEAEG
ncbi:MAG: sugar ABC transporter ATP-binding protein [Pirellulaceae bacterium]|jgi:ABC-type sugar transport system ATPase subunit